MKKYLGQIGAVGRTLAGAGIAVLMLAGVAQAATTISTVITTGGITVGSSGTAITQLLKGTCSLTNATYSITASTTAIFSCAVTGAASGDTAFVQFPATSTAAASVNSGWVVEGALASTTASNSVEVRVANLSGSTQMIPPSLASTTQYLIIR